MSNLLENLDLKLVVKESPLQMESGVAELFSIKKKTSAKHRNPYLSFNFKEVGTDESERIGVSLMLTFRDIKSFLSDRTKLNYFLVHNNLNDIANQLSQINVNYWSEDIQEFTLNIDTSEDAVSSYKQTKEFRDKHTNSKSAYIEKFDKQNDKYTIAVAQIDYDKVNSIISKYSNLFQDAIGKTAHIDTYMDNDFCNIKNIKGVKN